MVSIHSFQVIINIKCTYYVTGVVPITIRQSLGTKLVAAAL